MHRLKWAGIVSGLMRYLEVARRVKTRPEGPQGAHNRSYERNELNEKSERSPGPPVQVRGLGVAYRLIEDPGRVPEVLERLDGAPAVGVDIETTGLDPYKARVRTLQLAVPGLVYVIDAHRVDLRLLRPVLESEAFKILCHGKF
ncbi:MAG: hypothetical protein C4309_06060, partial [Chloroflexota bacterium]